MEAATSEAAHMEDIVQNMAETAKFKVEAAEAEEAMKLAKAAAEAEEKAAEQLLAEQSYCTKCGPKG